MGLHILMASDFYAPFIGGAERQVQLLGKELSARGHRVDIATTWHKGLPRHTVDESLNIYRMKALVTRFQWLSSDPKRRYLPPFPDPGIVWNLRRLIKRLRPDVVHAHGWIAYSAAAALIGTDVPLIISVRDYGYGCAVRTLLYHGDRCSGPELAKCYECTTRSIGPFKALGAVGGVFIGRPLLVRRVNALHAISTYVQEVSRRDVLRQKVIRGKSKGIMIPDFVIPSFLENQEMISARNEFQGQLPKGPYILFVGSLQRHKGLNELLTAYQRLHAPPPLVLIGTRWPDSPTDYPAGVSVYHNVPHNHVMTAWANCLFGVAPSLWAEPFGGVIVEGMSAGKAMISTNIGGPVDIIVHNETGLLVPPGDANALAAAMQQLLDQPAVRERFGQASLDRVQVFRAASVIPHFERLYHNVVDSPA